MRTKWIYTMFVLALSLFTSCNNEVDEAAGNKKTRTVVFRLSVDDAVGSRAAWGDENGYVAGNADVPFDTRINLDGLQVVVYDANNTYVGKAESVLYWPVSGNQNDNTKEEYRFVGDLSNLTLKEGDFYKFMVFANCANVGPTTEVGEHPYDFKDIANETGYIPMWGVKQQPLTGDELQDLEMIHLLRAAAKIEVALGEEMADYQLEEVTISHYNVRGWCAPTGWNTIDDTKDLDQEVCANFHASVSEFPLAFGLSQYKNSAKVYVPEYNNKHTSTHAATITVKLRKGVSTADTSDDGVYEYKDAIKFYTYSNGAPTTEELDIIRNHHYKFTITGVSGGLEIQYAVMDWVDAGEVKLETYEYPTYHNPLLPAIPQSDNKIDIAVSPTMYYVAPSTEETVNEAGAFVAYFRMTAPTEKTWTPTFKASQTDYAIRVYSQDGKTLKYSTIVGDNINVTKNLVASEDWYMIKIIPLNQKKANGTVNLGITYKISDNSTPFYLFINGTAENDIRWPNSGSDPKFIQIKQVSEQAGTNTNP